MLADLSAPQSMQVCIRQAVSGSVLEVLSSGCAHIQQLSLYCLTPSVLSSLKPMQDLTCLLIDRVVGQFEELELHPQPYLRHLKLGRIWLSTQQHAQLLHAYPALKVLICCPQHQPWKLQHMVCDGNAGKCRPTGNRGLRWYERQHRESPWS